jgi:glutathione synthase/RimK-type ligase-like ATP-grasp enzyme
MLIIKARLDQRFQNILKNNMVKRNFVGMLRELCDKNDWQISTLSDEWVSQIAAPKLNKTIRIVGYSFPLNTHVSAYSANDKGLTNDLLEMAEVPHVKHFFVYSDTLRMRIKTKSTLELEVQSAINAYGLPVVVKPCKGSEGSGVSLCNSVNEVLEKVREISKVEDICLSPFEDSEFEYRFYMLDDRVLLAYKKVREGDWRHNLSLGAVPVVIDVNKFPDMISLARQAMLVIGLRMGAVDIFDTVDGLKVLEVNNGVSLTHFAAASEENYQKALSVYEQYLSASFGVLE